MTSITHDKNEAHRVMTTASIYTHKSSKEDAMQLDLLTYTPSPAEATPPPEPPATPAPLTPRQQWYDELSCVVMRSIDWRS
jgi:hypothetical protein